MTSFACSFKNKRGKIVCFDGLYPHTIKHALGMAKSQLLDPSDHLYHLASLLFEILNSGFTEYVLTPSDYIDLLIFLDFPVPRRAQKLSKYKWAKCFVCEIENPLFTRHLKRYYLSLPLISPYQSDAWFSPKTAYLYKSIPKSRLSDESNDRQYNSLTSILCRNQAGPPNTLYGFRRHVINVFSLLGKEDFAFYGADWKFIAPFVKDLGQENFPRKSLYNQLTRLAKQALKSRFFIRDSWYKVLQRYPEVNLSCYRGVARSKHVLSSCRTTLAIENTNSIPGYVTEKALEPLIYGCMPLYVGTTTDNFLSEYIDILPSDILNVSASLSSYQKLSDSEIADEAERLRESINRDLLTGKITTTLGIVHELLEDL
jgi:hypothetical protein